jgi:urease accessory protein
LANLVDDDPLVGEYAKGQQTKHLMKPLSTYKLEKQFRWDDTDLMSDNDTNKMDNVRGLFGWLDLFQLADSALPVGSQSHSFGLETLIADGTLTAGSLASFLPDYLHEVGAMEAAFWRRAYALGAGWNNAERGDAVFLSWLALNRRLSALRPARESRAASGALGRRFLALAADMTQVSDLTDALQATRTHGIECHHVAAFGLTSGLLALEQEAALLAYFHQAVVGLLAACQKLLPIGQSELVRLRWRLKQTVAEVVTASATVDWRTTPPCCTPSLDVASMRHPGLAVRLFIS